MSPKSIFFIDSGINDYQILVDSINQQTDAYVLNGQSDGLNQIANILQGQTGIDAIHIISHGSPGALYLGNGVIDRNNFFSYESQLSSISNSLSPTGDILLYGCNLAQGEVGIEFISSLALKTGAEVAASIDRTGPSELGGNLVLESMCGKIEAAVMQFSGLNSLLSANTAPSYIVSDGQVTTNFGSLREQGKDVELQLDGKILTAGWSYNTNTGAITSVMARYNPDGSLDASFGADGRVSTSGAYGETIGIQADGKIVLSGNATGGGVALFRYNSDGSPDLSFDTDGKLVTQGISGSAIAIQSDGSIWVASNSTSSNNNFALLRFNESGNLDLSLKNKGIALSQFSNATSYSSSIALQADGKILVAGTVTNTVSGNSSFGLVRFNVDGSLDRSFGTEGQVTTSLSVYSSWPSSVAVQTDGKILVAGTASNLPNGYGDGEVIALVRYNADGSLDTSFDGDGKVTTSINQYGSGASDVIVQNDGKIVVAGWGYNGVNANAFSIVRYNSNGSLDSEFDADGKAITSIGTIGSFASSLMTQLDGKILVVGYNYGNNSSTQIFDLLRFNTDGTLDNTFSPPENTLNASPVYIENGSPVVLDSDVQILDAELTSIGSYNGASLTLSRHNGASDKDVFSSNSSTLSALLADRYFAVDGITIGRVTTNSAGTLKLTFNTNSNQSLVSRAMQQIAYKNTSDAPPTEVQIDWTFDDGNTGAQGFDGAMSVTGSTTVRITAVNDAPFLKNAIPDLIVPADTALSYVIPVDTFIDPDGDSLKWILKMADGTGLPPWLTWNATTRTISGTPSAADAGSLQILITATDYSGETTTDNFNVAVTVNTTPTLAVSLLPPSINEREFNDDKTHATSFTYGAIGSLSNANDVDWFSVYLNAPGVQTVTVDTSSMGAGIFNVYWYDPTTQAMSGKNIGPSAGTSILTYDVLVPASGNYFLRVQAANSTFYNGGIYKVYLGAPVQLLYIDTAGNDIFSNKTGMLVGNDVDSGTTLTYSINSGIDNGNTISKVGNFGVLTVTKASGAFAYVPNDTAIESLKGSATESFTVSVSDGQATTTSTLSINFNAINDTPSLVTPLADQRVTENQTLNFKFPLSSFSDIDDSSLVFTAKMESGSSLPDWLIFNSSDLSFIATPPNKVIGSPFIVQITATDGSGATVSDNFILLAMPAGYNISANAVFWKGAFSSSSSTYLPGVSLSVGGKTGTSSSAGLISLTGAIDSDGTDDGKITLDPHLDAPSNAKSAITLTDVLAALKVYLGKSLPESYASPLNYIAADFDGNGTVNLTDVLSLLKYYLGKSTTSAPAWAFVDAADLSSDGKSFAGANIQSISKTDTTPHAIDQSFDSGHESIQIIGILRGDVDGSWSP